MTVSFFVTMAAAAKASSVLSISVIFHQGKSSGTEAMSWGHCNIQQHLMYELTTEAESQIRQTDTSTVFGKNLLLM